MAFPRRPLPASVPFSRIDRIGLVAFAMAGLLTISVLGLSPRAQADTVAVVFAPWVPAHQAFESAAAAGARLVGAGRMPFVVIVAPEAVDYASRVRAAGALFSLDAAAFVACLRRTSARI